MTIYRLTPEHGAPVLRHAASIKGASSRGLREFPAGLRSVEVVGLAELTALAAAGVPLPAAARQRLEVHKAVERERARSAAKVQAVREAIREKAREAARAKREEEQARKEAEKAAEKRRKVLAERRAARQAQRSAQAAQGATQAAGGVPVQVTPPDLVIDPADPRLPWED
jgi:N-methylhydantoinase A/oxoprolinase/acetone carboxylase beta subunit